MADPPPAVTVVRPEESTPQSSHSLTPPVVVSLAPLEGSTTPTEVTRVLPALATEAHMTRDDHESEPPTTSLLENHTSSISTTEPDLTIESSLLSVTPLPPSSKLAAPGAPATESLEGSTADIVTSKQLEHSPASLLPTASAPQKRFTAVNVNRKFLEKSSTASTPVALAPATKATGNSPAGQALHPGPHSRLVTAKLTSLAQASQPSTVWSRGGSSSNVTTAGTTPSGAGQTAPLTSSVKGISSSTPSEAKLSGSQIKVWGARRDSGTDSASIPKGVSPEFPTAAEAASGKATKVATAITSAPVVPTVLINEAALKLQQEAADAFRGVHLDPKAHHWDDDADDDDDFLDQVIEFGDGTQYQVKSEVALPDPTPESKPSPLVPEQDESQKPVRKEDRFSEDIDRSWPRAPPLSSYAPASGPSASLPPPTHDRSSDSQGPAQGGRLFNDRSNRFEHAGPSAAHQRYSQDVGPLRQPSFVPAPQAAWSRRDGPSDPSIGAGNRKQHSSAPSGGNIQNLRKQSFSSAQDGESLLLAGPPGRSNNHGSSRGGPLSPQDAYVASAASQGLRSRGSSFAEEGSRQGGRGDNRYSGDYSQHLGQPYPRESSRESMRDPPPHRTMGPPPTIPLHAQRRPSRTSRDMPPPSFPVSHSAGAPPPASEAASSPIESVNRSPTTSLSSLRPLSSIETPFQPILADPYALKAPTMNDIAEFSKESMQSAAERARERRKAEEEQRERDKERARQKAVELAAIADAKKAEVEAAALAAAEALIVEEQAKLEAKAKANAEAKAFQKVSAEDSTPKTDSSIMDHALESSAPIWRVRSSRGNKRGADNKNLTPSVPRAMTRPDARPSIDPFAVPGTPNDISPNVGSQSPITPTYTPVGRLSASTTLPPSASPLRTSSWANVVKEADLAGSAIGPSADVKSWRSKPTSSTGPTPSLLDASEGIVHDDDTLEIVDFSDMGKFVGIEEESEPSSAETISAALSQSAPRDAYASHSLQRTFGAENTESDPHAGTIHEKPLTEQRRSSDHIIPSVASTSSTGRGMASPTTSSRVLGSPVLAPASKQHFRESSMSALEDTMSRIKGVLSTMAAVGPPRRTFVAGDFTSSMHPLPTWNGTPRVRLRNGFSKSALAPIAKRSLHMWKLPPKPVRMDILTWDPPVEGMSRRTLSRDETLFPSSAKIIVHFPPRSLPASAIGSTSSSLVVRVRLPPSSSHRRRDDRGTQKLDVRVNDVLDTVSRTVLPASPIHRGSLSLPGQISSTTFSLTSTNTDSTTLPTPPRPRAFPRRPMGSDVGFYRTPSSSGDFSSSVVSFTVTSEIEEGDPKAPGAVNEIRIGNIVNGVDETDLAPSVSRTITPPPKPTPWAKSPLVYTPYDSSSSTADADPENIKSLWATDDKDVVTTENSLIGLVDEPITFSLTDMKSDDGEDAKGLKAPPSPPPSIVPRSRRATLRMSVHDAHKAFQQVPPTPPSSIPEAPSPPTTAEASEGSRMMAQSSSVSPYPAAPRPYGVYSSSSPTPPMLYAQPYPMSPAQRPLANGLAPSTASHVWMPLTPGGMYPQNGYYRTAPLQYGQPVIYTSGVMPPYSPVITPMVPPKSINGAPPGTIRPQNGVTPQMMSPTAGPSPIPGYMQARPSIPYYPGGVQANTPYPPSPGTMYTAPRGTPPSGPSAPLYSSAPSGAYRPPPSW